MANIATYQEEKWLQETFKDVVTYCGLLDDSAIDAEGEGGTLTNEITTYTGNRPAITFGAITDVGGKATIKNSAALEFLVMPAVTVAYAIVCDAATAGNILYWAPLAANKICNAGDTFNIAIDALVLDLA